MDRVELMDVCDVDWPLAIGYHILVRRREDEVDPVGQPMVVPRAGAGEEEIAAVEAHLGALEPTYRSFLAHVNGWEGFCYDTALFDIEALLDPRMTQGIAQYLIECEVELDEIDPSHVTAISTISPAHGLVMMGLAGTPIAGQVISWVPTGGEFYSNFADFFAAATEASEASLEYAGFPRVAPRPTYDALGEQPDDARAEQVATARMIAADPAQRWPWPMVVACLATLKIALAERGLSEIWGQAPIAGGASAGDIEAVQSLYGTALFSDHANLLRAVDGWQQWRVSIDLLSTAQLQDPERMRPAVAHMRAVLSANGIDPSQHLVFASSVESADTVVVSRGVDGRLLWLHDDEIVATYPDLRHWTARIIAAHLKAFDAPSATP